MKSAHGKKYLMSKGEEYIASLLRAAGIRFIREKTFPDLQGGKFRFDFYLPIQNICIEVDGAQHHKRVSYFQRTREAFLRQQENDRRKNSYCLAHSIPLFRIPYWELDKISKASDLFQSKFRVHTRWHNDYLSPKK